MSVERIVRSTWRRHPLGLAALACLSLPTPALAACNVVSGFVAQDIIMDMGQVIIQPDAAVGELLASQEFTIHTTDTNSNCDGSGGLFLGRVLQGAPSSLASDIYETNVPGVGIRLARRRIGSGLDDLVVYPHDHIGNPNTNYSLAQGFFRVELYKIAPETGSGPLSAGMYSTYYGNGTGPSLPVLTSSVLGNGITLVSSACEVDAGSRNIVVDFGQVPRERFTGVGSTNTPRDFSISISCNGPNVGEDLVALSFEYTPHPSGSPGVIRLENIPDSASGMGVQLLDAATEAPIDNGDWLDLGTIGPNEERQFVQELRARYYQTEASVTPGETRALATFNIVYR